MCKSKSRAEFWKVCARKQREQCPREGDWEQQIDRAVRGVVSAGAGYGSQHRGIDAKGIESRRRCRENEEIDEGWRCREVAGEEKSGMGWDERRMGRMDGV